MTKAENLFYKAGEYAGKAAVYRKLRAKTAPGQKWLEYDDEVAKNAKKAASFIRRAEKASATISSKERVDKNINQ